MKEKVYYLPPVVELLMLQMNMLIAGIYIYITVDVTDEYVDCRYIDIYIYIYKQLMLQMNMLIAGIYIYIYIY